MASIKKNFVLNAAYQLLLIITPLVTTPYLSRILGPENIGIFSYTSSIANYFVMFAILGMSMYGVRAIAQAGDDRAKRSRVFWSAYFSQLSIALVVCVAYVIFTLFFQTQGLLLTALWSFWILSAVIDVSWLLFGLEEFKTTTIRSTAVKLCELILIFVLVKSETDLWLYIAIVSAGYFVMQAVIWPFVPKFVDFVRPSWSEISVHYAPNIKLFIPVIAISLYTTLDKIVLGAIAGMTPAGYFEYAEKISKIPLALLLALGTVMLPRMTSVLAAGEEEKARSMLGTSMWVMQVGAMAMAFGIIGIAPVFVPVFFGEDFMPCIELMSVLPLVIPIISGTNVLGRQYLIPRGRDNQYTFSIVSGAVINLAIIFVLIPQIGAMGATIGTLAAETTVLIVQAWFVRGELPLAKYVLNAIPFAVIGLAMAAAVRVAGEALAASLGGLTVAVLILDILVGAAIYTVLSLIFCIATKNAHFRALMKRN